MAHIFYINSLEKLNIKKDSSLMMALSLSLSEETYVFLEEDLYISNNENAKHKIYPFKGEFKKESFYLESFTLEAPINYQFSKKDTLYMRIDPPFDSRYQRYLWMLDYLQKHNGVKVLNSPVGIMMHNEKLAAFHGSSIESYVGSSLESFHTFINSLKDKKYQSLILKPLDLYSGIGVQKIKIDENNLDEIFEKNIKQFDGAIVCQPFIEKIKDGEIRAIFNRSKEIGSIIKTPPEGQYLANIAQGASFSKVELGGELINKCLAYCKEFEKDGIELLAFDILDNQINEINITCPGLLVEVSEAFNKNLCLEIF